MGLISELLGYRDYLAKQNRAAQDIKDARERLSYIIGMGTIADPNFDEEADKLRMILDEFCETLLYEMKKGNWYYKLETILPRRRGIR